MCPIFGHDGRAVAGAGQCLCRRQPARRRRVRPEWHQTAQGANKQRTWDDYIAVAEDLIRRRSPARAASAWSAAARAACWSAPPSPSGRSCSTPRSSRCRCSTCCATTRWRRRVVDRRIWRSGQARGARLDRRLFALPEAGPGQDLPDAVHPHLDQGRPRPPGPRPQGRGPPRGSSASLIIITRISTAATRRRRTCAKAPAASRWNIPTPASAWSLCLRLGRDPAAADRGGAGAPRQEVQGRPDHHLLRIAELASDVVRALQVAWNREARPSK
jgi:hypothetical protein